MSMALVEGGADTARLYGQVIVKATLAVTESTADTIGSTLMQQIAMALGPLAPGGAWPGRNTIEPPVKPYITFFRVVRPNEITYDGPTNVQPTRVQIDSISDRYETAASVARAVRATMLAFFVIGSIDEQDFPPDPETDDFRCSADFNVWSAD